MPRAISESNRVELRLRAEDKATLARAAALSNQDLSGFILDAAIPAARKAIEQSEKLKLSERDSLKVLALLESPPQPNARLRATARRLRSRSQSRR